MINNKAFIMNEAMKKRRASGAYHTDKITKYYFDEYYAHKDDSIYLREAYAHKNFYENMPVLLFPDELICGILTVNEPVFWHYSCGTQINMNIAREYAKQEKMTESETDAFIGKIRELDQYRYISMEDGIFTAEELQSMHSTASTTTFFGGHMIPDYENILSVGLGGYENCLIAKIDDGGNDLHKAMLIMLHGIQAVILRYAEKAASLSMNVDGLFNIVSSPPRNFREGIQLVWFIHLLYGRDSFGRFDWYLYPLYRQDTERGDISEDEVHSLVSALCIKVEEVGDIQNLTLGGTDENLADMYNGLTVHMLDCTRELQYKGPNLCLRVTETMPDNVWNAAVSCLGTGIGLPALYNDKIYYNNYINNGCDKSVAWNYCFGGCSQIMLSGRSCYINDIGAMNILKILEITLGEGCDFGGNLITAEALKTEKLDTYNKFYREFIDQLDYFIELEADINNKDIAHRASHEGYVMRSLFTRGCIDSGKSAFCGGAEYNGVELEIMGITNTADSIYAIKKLVYEDKKYTLAKFIEILKSDYKDHENLRLYLKNDIQKFGNDNDELDMLRAEISRYIFTGLNRQKGVNGGIYIPGEVIFTAHRWMGEACGASADGRKSGAVLADSCGATQGLDETGPTALLNSVLKIPNNFMLTTLVLNMKFTKEIWEDAAEKIVLLYKIFFARGGMQVQINVCDAETLKSAQLHPDEYRSLVVRVGGYSDYFVNLPSQIQDEIIIQTVSQI
ncbi:MAG: pyruvate formate lyase family protein [Eubacteriales bacterium]